MKAKAMASDRAGGLKRTSCGIVVIGQNPRLSKRIAVVLRVAGFRIATSVPEADLAFLRAVTCDHQTIAVLEVSSRFEETSRRLKNLRNAGPSRTLTPPAAADERRPTDRQAMILKSLVNGDSNKVVARKLHIAEETVKVHMKRLLRRIGVKNRTQAAIWALNNYFVPAANETGDLRRARPVTEPRSARRSTAPKTEFGGAPTGPQLSRSRGGGAKGTGKTIRKGNVSKYH
jgi:DNA-binding CsgD family transcriptional regulator